MAQLLWVLAGVLNIVGMLGMDGKGIVSRETMDSGYALKDMIFPLELEFKSGEATILMSIPADWSP